jgi:hypothetical protein
MRKKINKLIIGDHIREKKFKFKRRVGQIITILEDSKKNPTLECILVHPKTLLPIENFYGQYKVFKIKRDNVKYYVPRHKLFEKKSFEVGKYISHKGKLRIKYGRIICYLNQEEGLYPKSYDLHKHNGKDLLECVEINPNNLKRIMDEEDHPKIFVADPNNAKIVEPLDKDENGEKIIPTKLDI